MPEEGEPSDLKDAWYCGAYTLQIEEIVEALNARSRRAAKTSAATDVSGCVLKAGMLHYDRKADWPPAHGQYEVEMPARHSQPEGFDNS
jgi:hypothetical protein